MRSRISLETLAGGVGPDSPLLKELPLLRELETLNRRAEALVNARSKGAKPPQVDGKPDTLARVMHRRREVLTSLALLGPVR